MCQEGLKESGTDHRAGDGEDKCPPGYLFSGLG